MFILHNRTITQRSLIFQRMSFLVESVKELDSKTYYNTVTVEYPDEKGKFIYYLKPSFRLPLWSSILKQYYLRRFPLSSKMLDDNISNIKEFIKNNHLR